MKNKKTIITMIVIFVTAVFVVVGTYAYFASSVDSNGTSYLNTTLPAGSYNFTVTRAGELNMTFTSDQMMASGVSTDAIVNGNTDIEVQLLSSDNDSEVTCTYDLVWEWKSLDKYTTSDATLPLVENAITYNYEYSVEATSETTGSPRGTNYGSSNTLNEKDLSKYTWSGNKATILSGAKITSKSSETPTITNWDIKANIYNIPVNQVNLLDKEFKATIKVDNVECSFAGGTNETSESGVIEIVSSGTINDIGTEVAIGDEHFFVYDSNTTTVKLLPKYNLLVGYKDGSDKTLGMYTDADEGYNLQSASAVGYASGSNPCVGAISFASTNYWSENSALKSTYGSSYEELPYVYDSNSNLYEYVENYKTILEENYDISILEARLLSKEEFDLLDCAATDSTCTISPDWVYSAAYWTGVADDNKTIIQVGPSSILGGGNIYGGTTYSLSFMAGVRPILVIEKSEL